MGNQLLDFVHIDAGVVHGNRNHFVAEGFGNGKMAVVARNGAEPLYIGQLIPGCGAKHAKTVKARNSVIHKGEARVATYKHVFGLVVEHEGHKALSFRNAVKHAIVATVSTIFCDGIIECSQDASRKRQLVGTRFATCHIERKSLGLYFVILLLQLLKCHGYSFN